MPAGSVIGAIVVAMGYASCFQAIALLGVTVPLGFLGQFEVVFINTLLHFSVSASEYSCVASRQNRLTWSSLQVVALIKQ